MGEPWLLLECVPHTHADNSDSWLNAEAREYVFDPKTLDGDCFLYQKEQLAVAGGYAPTSTEADIVTGKL